MSEKTIIVIGTGTAALACASSFPPSYQVTVITKRNVTNSNSHYAQGGIAVSYAKDDSIESHVNDTLYAGCGHNDVTAVRHLLQSGQSMINRLIEGHFLLIRSRTERFVSAGKALIPKGGFCTPGEMRPDGCWLSFWFGS